MATPLTAELTTLVLIPSISHESHHFCISQEKQRPFGASLATLKVNAYEEAKKQARLNCDIRHVLSWPSGVLECNQSGKIGGAHSTIGHDNCRQNEQPSSAEFKRWTEAGIRVFLFDAHSFGRSEPLDKGHRSLVSKSEHLVDDVYQFRTVSAQVLTSGQEKKLRRQG